MGADIAKWTIADGNRSAANRYDIPYSTIHGFIRLHNEDQFSDEDDFESTSCKNAMAIIATT